MAKHELVRELIKKNNGFITASEAAAAGVNNKTLQRMQQSGVIERGNHCI